MHADGQVSTAFSVKLKSMENEQSFPFILDFVELDLKQRRVKWFVLSVATKEKMELFQGGGSVTKEPKANLSCDDYDHTKC